MLTPVMFGHQIGIKGTMVSGEKTPFQFTIHSQTPKNKPITGKYLKSKSQALYQSSKNRYLTVWLHD
jgi:hypothetical protein